MQIQDIYLYRGTGEYRLDSHLVSAGYTFEMAYPPSWRISFILAEWRRNGRVLPLRQWKDERVVNADARFLSFNTVTDTFTCRAGDTLSFYRELTWTDLDANPPDHNIYYALDTLDFAVELVRVDDSVRVALLDSLGILRRDTPGEPTIYGHRPLLATTRWVAPPELEGTRTFMRLLLYHRGSGDYWFTRSDEIMIDMSHRVEGDAFQPWADMYVPQAPKPSLSNRGGRKIGGNSLAISKEGNNATITFEAAPPGTRTSLGIYDMQGNVVFMPYTSAVAGGRHTVRHCFTTLGAYLIGLFHGNRLVNSAKLTIQQ